MTDISVIILTGKEELHIQRCLECLAPLAPRQIFIVESQHGDNTHSLAISTAQTLGWSIKDAVLDRFESCRSFGIPKRRRHTESVETLRVAVRRPALKIRRCQDLVIGHEGLLSKLINKPMQRRLASDGFRMTDHFAMNAGHTDDPKWFSHLLATLPDGITEIGVHPGDNEPWRIIDTTDCFTPRDWTDIERITFNDL